MEAKEEKHRLQTEKWAQRIKSKIFWIGIAVFVGLMSVTVSIATDFSRESKVTTISEASLKKVIATSQLSTMEYTFNGVTRVTKEFFDTTKYYVAYEGTVRAGIDFSAIDISLDEKTKVISIALPDVTVQSVSVDIGSMEYIFEEEWYENETVANEAYRMCVKDLTTRAESEVQLFEMARENAKATVKALIEPWVKQVEEYSVEII